MIVFYFSNIAQNKLRRVTWLTLRVVLHRVSVAFKKERIHRETLRPILHATEGRIHVATFHAILVVPILARLVKSLRLQEVWWMMISARNCKGCFSYVQFVAWIVAEVEHDSISGIDAAMLRVGSFRGGHMLWWSLCLQYWIPCFFHRVLTS